MTEPDPDLDELLPHCVDMLIDSNTHYCTWICDMKNDHHNLFIYEHNMLDIKMFIWDSFCWSCILHEWSELESYG